MYLEGRTLSIDKIFKWSYYILYSFKLYLQLFHNIKRLRMIGFNFETLSLNISSFALLNISHLVYFIYYKKTFDIFDYIFAIHSLFLNLLFLYQCYKDKKYKTHKVLSWNSKGIISFSLLSPCVFLLLENIHAYRVKQNTFNSSVYLLFDFFIIYAISNIFQIIQNKRLKSFYSSKTLILIVELMSNIILILSFGYSLHKIMIINENPFTVSQYKYNRVIDISLYIFGILSYCGASITNIILLIQYMILYKNYTVDTGNAFYLYYLEQPLE